MIGPPWSSMIADLTPPALRSRYFGVRTWITNLVALIFSFVSAGLLSLKSNISLSYMIVNLIKTPQITRDIPEIQLRCFKTPV